MTIPSIMCSSSIARELTISGRITLLVLVWWVLVDCLAIYFAYNMGIHTSLFPPQQMDTTWWHSNGCFVVNVELWLVSWVYKWQVACTNYLISRASVGHRRILWCPWNLGMVSRGSNVCLSMGLVLSIHPSCVDFVKQFTVVLTVSWE